MQRRDWQGSDLAIASYSRGDYKPAVIAFEKLAHQGNADAQFYLGLMYRNGEGVMRNDKRGLYWYSKAAQQGNADAQFNLE